MTLDPLHHFRSKGIHADWTVCEVVLLMQTKISWKMAKVLWITVVIAILEKWVWSGSIIAWLISHRTLLELRKLGSWKDFVERRRWEKTFHILKLFNNTTKGREVSTWRTCSYPCIEYHSRQSAVAKRYSGISLIWQRSMVNSIPLALSSECKTT